MRSMNFLRFTATVKAKNLMQDDWFRMGGEIYRITDVSLHKGDKMVEISFKPAHYAQNSGEFFMTVTAKTKFKTYNQK